MKQLIYRYIILLLFITSFITLNAQNTLVGLGFGGATFSMNSTKEYNNSMIKLLPFTPEITDNFPPYFYYTAEVLYSFPKTLALGVKVTSTSTGSRLNLADYSGEYTFDNMQHSLTTGLKLVFGEAPGKTDGMCATLECGLAFSTMIFDENIEIGEEPETYHEDFDALGFYICPGMSYHKSILPEIQLAANLSYYFSIEKGYHVPGAKDQIIYSNETSEAIKPQWDGLRLGITLYYNMK